MKGKPIDQLVYEHMFPKHKERKPADPQNFWGLLHKYLVQEVRAETTSFYGSLSTREAQYPGLDYSYPPHRARLSRFTWHRRLFRAFDALQLTKSEIARLTKWEGTLWAKERFEKEQGIIIRDTTGDCISDWVPPNLRKSTTRATVALENDFTEIQDRQVYSDNDNNDDGDDDDEEAEENDVDDDQEGAEEDYGDDSDLEIESVGIELNERLRRAVAQREAGDNTVSFDAEFEQWLKETTEATGEIPTGSLPDIISNFMRVMEGTSQRYAQRRQIATSGFQQNAAAILTPGRQESIGTLVDIASRPSRASNMLLSTSATPRR